MHTTLSPELGGSAAVLEAKGVWKIFQRGRRIVKALSDVDVEIGANEFACLVGPSGSGKSTLLGLLGALDVPTKGEVEGLGHRYSTLSNEQRNRFRREHIGFVFQELRLVSHLTATENVMLPRLFDGEPRAALEPAAAALLDRVQMAARADHFPYELSYGERQRVAIARALATKPKIVLADEPTANLDDANAERVRDILIGFARSGTTLVVATHDPRLFNAADRLIRVENGQLVAA